MPRVVAVLKGELASGFSLTGVDVIRVEEPYASGAREALESAVNNPEYGLVIVDQTLLDEVDDRLRTSLHERNLPLVIPVPGDLRWRDVESAPEDEYVAQLVKRAVGYQLKVEL